MERTVAVVVFLVVALAAAAMIIAFVANSRQALQQCADEQCTGKTNGETFCTGSGLGTCVLENGCLRVQERECACAVDGGIAQCP